MQGVSILKVGSDIKDTDVVKVFLAFWSAGFQCAYDLVLRKFKLLLAGNFLRKVDEKLVAANSPEGGDPRVRQARAIQLSPDRAYIRRVRVLYVHQRAAPEVDTQGNAMPKQHRANTGYAEDQRKRNEV